MVDGIIQLTNRHIGMRLSRELCVRKFRGSGYVEGFHSYTITGDGIIVWPRIEAWFQDVQPGEARDEIVPLGVAGLDRMLEGGVRRDSVTLLVGATGVGKTMLALQFLRDGVAAGEPCLYFGLFEDPSLLTKVARRIGMTDEERAAHLTIVWQPDTERVLDALGCDLLRTLETSKARRLVIDGMVAFKTAADDIERLPTFFAALTNELRRRGVTTLFTEELHDVVGGPMHVPIENISANCDNILFLRQLEKSGRMARQLSIVKTRGGGHDPTWRPFEVTTKGVVIAGSQSTRRAKPARPGAAQPRKRRR
jgi:circadian clock protein KaiC